MPVDDGAENAIRVVAMLGNHLPRQCGIATFTTDLVDAIELGFPEVDSFVVAMNAPGMRPDYPERVRFEVTQGDFAGYSRASNFLNVRAPDVVSVQHEYGIFGGVAGRHVVDLLRELRMPVVTTLHTILAEPDAAQRAAMDAIVSLSERLVVMSHDGARLLRDVHRVDVDKIDVIPHGIPVAPERHSKKKISRDGGAVILTFGLLSPDKGLEYVIDAMPAILARHPETVYVIVGATHPHVRQSDGEAYRLMLQARAERLGVASHVIFHNRFVSHAELLEFLGAADVYVTPYLKAEQSTSGTLAYAVGCGKAIISTPYRYAKELLADERGVLVEWRDAGAIGREVNGLLDDPDRRQRLESRAAAFGKSMTWPTVAKSYLASFARAAASYDRRARAGKLPPAIPTRRVELPELDLAHVLLLTDDTGILQHATYDIPNYRDGYCIDDNARALLLMTYVEEAGAERPEVVRALATRYLAFVNYAFDPASGRFRNFMSHARAWHDEPGSDDSQGRALWALGTVVARKHDPGRAHLARRLFHAGLPAIRSTTSPRAWAYALLGIEAYAQGRDGADRDMVAIRAALVTNLCECLRRSRRSDWPWFEDRLTYCNARLPQALLVSAARAGDRDNVAVAIDSLAWLAAADTSPKGMFAPVGTNGFHVRGEQRASFDQQPVEACAMVSACIDAHRITGEQRFVDYARLTFHWFLGQNALDTSVYDARTAGCRDGIHVDRMNENQGAESTLSFLIALAEMRAAARLEVPS